MRDQDELLKRYLLGDLEEEEESRLEARLIREDEIFESLEAAEADLLDQYAHGGLAPEERGRIERRLLSSPEARRRLAVIHGLGKIADEETNGRRVLPGPWGGKKLSLPQMRALAAAAMLVIAVGSVWIARLTVPIPDDGERVVELPAPTPVPVAPAPVPPSPPPVEDRIAETRPTPAPAPPALVLQLAFAVARGEGEIEERVIPAGTERVELRLDLDGELEAHRRYTVKLVDTTTLSTVHEERLQPREIGGEPLLVLELDASLLEEHMLVEIYEDGAQDPLVTKEVDVRRQDG